MFGCHGTLLLLLVVKRLSAVASGSAPDRALRLGFGVAVGARDAREAREIEVVVGRVAQQRPACGSSNSIGQTSWGTTGGLPGERCALDRRIIRKGHMHGARGGA